MIQNMIHKLAELPEIFILLRRLLEDDFGGEKQVIAREFAGTDGPVLDVGCGTGELSPLSELEKYTGIEISPAYIRYAQTKYSHSFHVMDATRMEFANASFSRALIVGVLHYLSNNKSCKVVNEIHRVLRPRGRLLLLEDVILAQHGHPIGRRIHKLDKDDFIRSRAGYHQLFKPNFIVIKEYLMRSGVCDYAVFVLEKRERGEDHVG